MSRIHTIIASAAAALLISGTAMAASLQPSAGEAPFFDGQAASSSTLTRAAVEAEAAAQRPAAGEMSAVAVRPAIAAPARIHAVQTGDMPVSGNVPYYAL
ncbi:MAG: hypothetical protein WCZ18_06655 [Ottowia sp.]|nr:hypothetical protein [Ottowia sp.]